MSSTTQKLMVNIFQFSKLLQSLNWHGFRFSKLIEFSMFNYFCKKTVLLGDAKIKANSVKTFFLKIVVIIVTSWVFQTLWTNKLHKMLRELPIFSLLLFIFGIGIGFRTDGELNVYTCFKNIFPLFIVMWKQPHPLSTTFNKKWNYCQDFHESMSFWK